MEKENKYMLREKGIPYYYEYDLTRNPGVYLKEFEIFDGKEVKWGVREDYIKITDGKYCRMTPLFQNMTDENGKDIERFIYLEDYKFLIHGKLNDSEVLCKLNDNSSLDTNLVDIMDFGGKDVKITVYKDGTAQVRYKENDLPRCIFFNYKDFSLCSNVFDGVYDKGYFLKSYIINDHLRMFLGKLSYSPITVKEMGYDINKQEFISFPLNDNGLIDENEMMNYFLKDGKIRQFDKDIYQKTERNDLAWVLYDLHVHAYDVVTRLDKYNEYNESKSKRLIK